MIYAFVAGLVIHSLAYHFAVAQLTRRHTAQVDFLLQRIQDPVAAVTQHAMQVTEYPVQHLPFNDDEAWQKYSEDMNGRG